MTGRWRRALAAAGVLVAAFFCVLMFLLAAVEAIGAPPPGADQTLAPYFRSLTRPGPDGTEIGCCDLSDCRPVRSRLGPDGYEVLIDRAIFDISELAWLTKFGVDEPQWVKVPNETILQGKENPFADRAVVCWTPGRGVICMVRPTEY